MTKSKTSQQTKVEREVVNVFGSLLELILTDIREQHKTLSSELDRLKDLGVEVAYLYPQLGSEVIEENQKNKAKANQ